MSIVGHGVERRDQAADVFSDAGRRADRQLRVDANAERCTGSDDRQSAPLARQRLGQPSHGRRVGVEPAGVSELLLGGGAVSRAQRKIAEAGQRFGAPW